MSSFHQFVTEALADRLISEAEVRALETELFEDGRLDLDDVKLLVELYAGSEKRSPSFDKLFFSVMEKVLLEDGEIQLSEQFYLLKMLYSDREIRDSEREFLKRLQQKATRRAPEFDALCETAFKATSTNWCVGGRESVHR